MKVIDELRRIERDILPAPWATARGSFNALVLSVGRLCIASLGWNTREEDAKHARAIVAMRNSHAALLRVAEAVARYAELDDLECDLIGGQPEICPAIVTRGGPCHWCEMRAALAELEQVRL